MCQNSYAPEGPYVFRNGDHKDQTTEELLLKDPEYLICLYKRIKRNSRPGSKKNLLEKHLDWLFSKIEEIKPLALCPYCQEKNIKFMAEVGPARDSSFLPGITCCKDEECKKRLLRNFPSADLIKLSFFSLSNFRGQRRDDFKKILKKMFCLPERLNKKTIFQYFKTYVPKKVVRGQWVIDF